MGDSQQLAAALQATLSPQPTERKNAERYLEQAAAVPGHMLQLMQLVQDQGAAEPIRQAAAVAFKNFVKKHWAASRDESHGLALGDDERGTVKQHIVSLMLASPSAVVRKQLATAVGIVAQSDFPAQWPDLLPELCNKMQSDDLATVNGVLSLLHSIFRSYRQGYLSEGLQEELKYVLANFAAPFLALTQKVGALVSSPPADEAATAAIFRAALYCAKIFYSLNYLTIPEFFEDNIAAWMEELRRYVQVDAARAPRSILEHESGRDDKAGLLHKLQANAFDCVKLYMSKYEEEFDPFVGAFLQDAWTLLAKDGDAEQRLDRLAISAMGFLATVSTSVRFDLFKDGAVLKQVCEGVVIPNVKFRDCDEELFEDQPMEYVKRDIEGSDADTRRRAALEVVRGLRKHYEQQVTEIFSSYVGVLLGEGNWRATDCAMFLVTALAVSAQTAAGGVTKTNALVPVLDFFQAHVMPRLEQGAANPGAVAADTGSRVLCADALKFTSTFRGSLPPEAAERLVPVFAALVAAPCPVTATYAAGCVDRFLAMRDKGVPRVPPAAAGAVLPALVPALFGRLLDGSAPREVRENVYLAKALLRVVTASPPGAVLQHGGAAVPSAAQLIQQLAAAPGDPTFTHYIFETIAALVKIVTQQEPAACAQLEAGLFPAFQGILAGDVQELMPYCLQIIAQLLERSPEGVTANYESLLPAVLTEHMWDSRPVVPALVRLTQAFVKRAPEKMAGHLPVLVSLFRKLVVSKATDHDAFLLVESVVEHMPFAAFEPHLGDVLSCIFGRLTQSKTAKFIKSFVIFMALLVGKHECDSVVGKIDSLQEGLFGMVLGSCWLPYMQKVRGGIERKMMAVGSLRIVGSARVVGSYPDAWLQLLARLVALFELPADDDGDDEGDGNGAGGGGLGFGAGGGPGAVQAVFQGSFVRLHHAAPESSDPFAGVDAASLRGALVQALHTVSGAMGGKMGQALASLDPNVRAGLENYAKNSGTSLPTQ